MRRDLSAFDFSTLTSLACAGVALATERNWKATMPIATMTVISSAGARSLMSSCMVRKLFSMRGPPGARQTTVDLLDCSVKGGRAKAVRCLSPIKSQKGRFRFNARASAGNAF